MRKVLIITVGLLVAFGTVGCKSKRDKTAEKQLAIAKLLGEKVGIDSKTMAYDIVGGLDLKTGEITRLDLSGRGLTVLPPEIGLLTGLEELDLRNNKLTELPEEIGNLKKLKKLNISMNRIEKLPNRIGDLIELLELDIGENNIEMLPESIGNLANLTRFAFDRNNLSGLPESIGNMKKLTYIAAHNNKFKIFPKALGLLPPGKSFSLSDGFDTTTLPPNVKHKTGGMYYVSGH